MNFKLQKFSMDKTRDILNLFQIVFERPMSKKFFNWRYLNTPWGEGIFSLAYDDDVLAASYSIMSCELIIDNNPIKVGFSMTTMTHPNYRGKGLFPKLANDVYNQASDMGYDLIVGFPNDVSYNGFVNKLGWNGFGSVTLHTIDDLSKFVKIATSYTSDLKFKMIDDQIKMQIDSLVDDAQKEAPVHFPRGSEYIKWRFIDNPLDQYTIFGFYLQNEIQGYYVLKYYKESSGKKIAHLIDFKIKIPIYLYDVLVHISEQISDNDITKITFWLNENHLKIDELSDLRQILDSKKMERTFFGYKLISNRLDDKTINILNTFLNWDLKMSDSDTF